MGRTIIKLKDWDGDTAQVSFRAPDVPDAAGYPTAEGAHDDLIAAIEGVTLGTTVSASFVATEDLTDPAPNAASPVAQTNIQWLVTATDDVDGSRETWSIPTADIATPGLLLANSSFADMTHANWIAFRTAFEARVRSDSGNAVTIESIEYKE